MKATGWMAQPTSEEFQGAELGDPRRTRRLCEIAGRVSVDPAASFPDAFNTAAELEGFYRFLRSEHVRSEKILEPHLAASCDRASQLEECLVIHDTTEFNFSSEREGLGKTSANGHGYFAHTSLLVAPDAARTPLGVGGLEQYSRQKRRGRSTITDRRDDESCEGRRWLRAAEAVETRAAGRFQCIHIADREGDTFHFLHGLLENGSRFVIRVAQDRCLEDEFGDRVRLHEPLLNLKVAATFDIELSARDNSKNRRKARTHPSRRARKVQVSIGATTVTVTRPNERQEGTPIELNLVRVWESRPSTDEPPVEWVLWTTEAIDTPKQMRKVVEYYRCRWVIEEYFKALKTGCNFEKRQLESFQTLTAALAVFAPVAWKLLLLRSLAHSATDHPAIEVLSPIQLKFLEKKYGKPIESAGDAFKAIAKLGGHLKQNGNPGWQTLGRGYEKLVTGEAFLLLLESPRDL